MVSLIDWFEERDCFLLVMEKPDNCTDLFEYISERGVLTEETAREIFIQVEDPNDNTNPVPGDISLDNPSNTLLPRKRSCPQRYQG